MKNSKQKVNLHCGTRLSCFNVARQKWFLPDFNCSCMSKLYLETLIFKKCPFFRVNVKDVHPVYVPLRRKSASELLELIEDILKERNLQPTGFSIDSPPNISWLESVLAYLDANNDYFHPERLVEEEKEEEMELDPE